MIPSATRYSKKYYTVTCSGPCRGIGIKLQYSSGDADLCAKYAIPIKKFRYCEKAKKFVELVNNVKTKCEIFFFSNFSGFLRISEVIVLKPLLIRISEKIPFRLKMTLKIAILHSANLPVLVKLTNVQTSELEVTSSLFW